MRLLIVPVVLVALFVQAPAPALGNTNQAAAEKIADLIGERFPDADIDVMYNGGQVSLRGEAVSSDQRKSIVEQVSNVPGVNVTDVKSEIQIVAPRAPARAPAQSQSAIAAVTAPIPMPGTSAPRTTAAVPAAPASQPVVAANATQARQPARTQQAQPQQLPPRPQQALAAAMPAYPNQHYAPAFGLKPGQESAVAGPYAPASYHVPAQAMQQYMGGGQYQPAYGPQGQMAYHPEAYGPQGPLPGQYNQPNLPDYAWPSYANYPNYSQVSYPRSYSPKAWPYIGPFYPYPQVPLGWRKVTLEHHNGWWWLDFDDGTPSGPFSGLFRQPQQYTY